MPDSVGNNASWDKLAMSGVWTVKMVLKTLFLSRATIPI